MGERSKRRKDKYNPYTIYEKEGKYYISFKDGQGQRNSLEVEKELYDAFNDFELEDLSYLNVWDRHLEQSEVWEATLNERAVEIPESVEEIVFHNIQNEKVHRAISKLPCVQQRRIKLYFFEGLTYKQIADLEQCKYQAIEKSVKSALKNIKKFLE